VFALFGCADDGLIDWPSDESGFYALPLAEFNYNLDPSVVFVSYVYPDGMFQEPLDDREIRAIIPDERFPCTGKAAWDGAGELLWVDLDIHMDDRIINLYFPVSFGLTSPDVQASDPVYTLCHGLTYEIVEFPYGAGTTCLEAKCVSDGLYFLVNELISDEKLEEERPGFETIIRWVSLFGSRKPNLNEISYDYIPEYYNLSLSEEEAYEDKTFGHLLPRDLPASLNDQSENSFSHHKDYRSEILVARWGTLNKFLQCSVEHYTEEDDRYLVREDVISAARKNASIFRVEDVTVEVLETIKNVHYSGDTIAVRIKVGDFYIRISTRGVTPEELYAAIQTIGKQ
jgi:hypothetical protein